MTNILSSDYLHALEFSLTIGCSLDCRYCPQDLLRTKFSKNKSYTKYVFSFDDFKKCLAKVQKGSEISFCGMSEPFHNDKCADMIVYAYDHGYKISLLTTLVGMTKTDFYKIKHIDFDCFVLHIPDEEHNSKFIIDKEYLEILKLVNNHFNIDYYSCHGEIHHKIFDIIDKTKYAGISLCDRAGYLNIEGLKKIVREGQIVCFHGSQSQVGGWAPVVFPDGTLVLCCHDYGMQHILGNLIEQSWDEIKKSGEYTRYINGMADDSIPLLCRKCSDARNIEELPSMQLKKRIEKWRHKPSTQPDSSCNPIIARLSEAENVCVFGLGKLFRDHFFNFYWNKGLGVNVLTDNNPKYWGEKIKDISCVPPAALSSYENLLVVIFVKNDESIKNQLLQMNITNYINIYDIFNMHM